MRNHPPAAGPATVVDFFIQIPRSLLGRGDVGPAAKLVWGRIADMARNNGEARFGIRRLAEDCGLSPTTAAKSVRRLEELGLLVVVRPEGDSAGHTNRYSIPEFPPSGVPESDTRRGAKCTRNEGGVYQNTDTAYQILAQRENERKHRGRIIYNNIKLDREAWEWEGITAEDRRLWSTAYPACDIDRELARMILWAKTAGAKGQKRDWGRFIEAWLVRQQNSGGSCRKGTNGNGDGGFRVKRPQSSARRRSIDRGEYPEVDRPLPTL